MRSSVPASTGAGRPVRHRANRWRINVSSTSTQRGWGTVVVENIAVLTSADPAIGSGEYRRRTAGSARAHARAGGLRSGPSDLSYPPYLVRGAGARAWDIDGNEYVDFHLDNGALAAGHAHPAIVGSVAADAADGIALCGPSTAEGPLAEELARRYPFIDRIRFTPSGAEAVAVAIRDARIATGRTVTIGVDTGRAVDAALVVPFNDLGALAAAFDASDRGVAAVVMEPVLTGAGVIAPVDGYLAGVRELTRRHGAVLVFDEVRTGFRVAPGGATQAYGVVPDVVAFGAAGGGGLPFGGYGGGREVVGTAEPRRGSSLNPLCARAALTCLTEVLTSPAQREAERVAQAYADGLGQIARTFALPLTVTRLGTLGGLLLLDDQPRTAADVAAGVNVASEWDFWFGMLSRGVIPMGPVWSDMWSVSVAHTELDVERALDAAEQTLSDVFGI